MEKTKMSIAAIDIGLKRIGTALSPNGKMAIPATPILRKNRNQAAREVVSFLEENNITILIVGLPRGGASEEEMERRIRHFVGLLEFTGTIHYENEYGSSYEAKEMSSGVFKHKKDGRVDSLAAQIILTRYLERS